MGGKLASCQIFLISALFCCRLPMISINQEGLNQSPPNRSLQAGSGISKLPVKVAAEVFSSEPLPCVLVINLRNMRWAGASA